MSKLDYSTNISNKIYSVLKHIDSGNPNELLNDYDKSYVMALCIAYLTLSKEKIIKKDKNITDKMERLDKKVNDEEINYLFSKEFSNELPTIIETDSTDYLWILDNFRDSIMHGVFDIDLEQELLIINNKCVDRKLKAKIPFDWLIKYAKYDIRSKKESNYYYFKGIYYDKFLKDKECTRDEVLDKSIIYNVIIEGDKFNIKEIENRVRELFDEYSLKEIDKNSKKRFEKYYLPFDNFYFDTFISFKQTSEIVKCLIKEEYGLSINIGIAHKTKKIEDKIKSKLDNTKRNYDVLYKDIKSFFIKKSDKILDLLTLIIDNLGSYYNIKYNMLTASLEEVLKKEGKITYSKDSERINRERLASLFVTVFGISTIVINNEYLKNNTTDEMLQMFDTYSHPERIKNNVLKDKILKELYEDNIFFYKLCSNIEKCKSENGKEHLKNKLKELQLKMIDKIEEYKKLEQIKNRTYKPDSLAQNDIWELENDIFELQYVNEIAETLLDDKTLKKVPIDYYRINELKRDIKKIEDNYIFDKCTNNCDILKLVRNSLSHIGRVSITTYNNELYIKFYDFDDDHHLSGCAYCKYKDFMLFLDEIFYYGKEKVIK